MTLAEEYKKSLKLAEAEEILDLVLYRPIAFIMVKLIYRLPITPNQVTYISLIAGLVSAFEFARGTPGGFLWGAIWYAIANVLDCGDGMLARLQKSGTPLGRIVDGIVDWVSSVAIFYGLGVGMSAYFGDPLLFWPLAVVAGVVSGYHAMVFDKRQQEYISAVRGERNFHEREREKVDAELKNGSPLRRVFLSMYRWYMTVQEGASKKPEARQHHPEHYRRHNKKIMRWWTFLGPTTNRTLLMLAGVLAHPEWFCWLVVLPANLYLVFMLVWQKRVTRRLNRSDDSTHFRAAPIAA